MRRHVLLTGAPGVGKTTLIRAIAHRLAEYDPKGFYTEEIRDAQGLRQGFCLVSLDGHRAVLARRSAEGPHRVGRYGVDLDAFERFFASLDLLHETQRPIIIDEIGKMECLSSTFRHDVPRLLESATCVIATIALKGDRFIQELKERPDCRLIAVTVANRQALADDLIPNIIAYVDRVERRGLRGRNQTD
jgi:nucleoside-triphosphatase